MKKFGTIILLCFTLASVALLYQNCGGQQPTNSLCFGGNCNGPQPSGGCPTGTYFIAASNTCTACQYGYNSAAQSCNPYVPPGSTPSFSCTIVDATNPAITRPCTATSCAINCNETLKCSAHSNITPDDTLYGCSTPTTCTTSLKNWPDWTYTPVGNYDYSWKNVNNNTTDVSTPFQVKDSAGQTMATPTITFKACVPTGGGGSTWGPQAYTLNCNAGNNQSISVPQVITLPASVSASGLRIISQTVNSWTNNGFNASQSYPYIFRASFTGNTLNYECTQAGANVTFNVGVGLGGNTTWLITNRSQLP